MSSSAQEIQQAELTVGDFAPDFTMDIAGGSQLTLSDQRGKNVVLYFYPKDDTPGCTVEANDFTRLKREFDDASTIVIGLSKDTVESHDKFCAKHDLDVILASDANSTVCEAYGCWVEKNMYGKKYMGIRRDTFLLDSKGQIKKIWRKVKVEGHAQEVLEEARALDG